MPVTATTRKPSESIVMHGIGVSPGVVVGPVVRVGREMPEIVERTIGDEEVAAEILRLEDGIIETRREIKRIQKDLATRAGTSNASVLDAHLMVLDDGVFMGEVIQEVRGSHRNVESALRGVTDKYAKVLGSVEDDYLRERVADIRDVTRRLLKNLSGQTENALSTISHRHIVVAPDLAPSETAGLRKGLVLGLATDLGSATSHTAVLAHALEIPAIVGLHELTKRVQTGDEILIDGNRGLLIINPSAEQMEQYGRLAETRRSITKELSHLKDQPAVTRDGHRIVLAANLEDPSEVPAVRGHGAEGVGLFRSEYLFLIRKGMVGEADQAAAYTQVAHALAPAPVIIRTLDLGGDKVLPKSAFSEEVNPFLGCRSIRLSLVYPEEFKKQLRAILRSSSKGNVKIMYPMISNVGEVVRANELLGEAKLELEREGVPFDPAIEVGAMVEVPSAALTADVIAEHVSFFSLGTNDLVQYTLAVDRINERVAYLYEPTHPAVLELMRRTIAAGHARKRWVGVCGEMAADPLLAVLLVGMGADELSMAPAAVPLVKDAIRSVSYAETQRLAEISSSCKSAVEVLAHCRRVIKQSAPELLELI